MFVIKFTSEPYDEENVLHLFVAAKGVGFSGFAEIMVHPDALADFGDKLTGFPADINHKVNFEYGDTTGKWAYYLLLQALVIDHVGHSAMRVCMHSFVGMPGNGNAEFYIPSEAASINDLGRAIKKWVLEPSEPLVWQPRA